jgi:hypothetical protein
MTMMMQFTDLNYLAMGDEGIHIWDIGFLVSSFFSFFPTLWRLRLGRATCRRRVRLYTRQESLRARIFDSSKGKHSGQDVTQTLSSL